MIGSVISAVSNAFTSRQQRKAKEAEAAASVKTQLSTNKKEVTLKKTEAEALLQKAAIGGLASSWKDELATVVICLFFFILPSLYAVVDTVFGTTLLDAHLWVFRLLMEIETEGSALGLVFVGVMLAAVGITGLRSFFRR